MQEYEEAATGAAGRRDQTRARIAAAAADLLSTGGRDAVSTRSVAAAAGTQPPTIYRLFGDKEGLLASVAEQGFAAYLEEKGRRPRAADPLADLRAGWDLHVSFGLANPILFSLMYGEPRPGRQTPAAAAAIRVLHERVRAIAAAGLLTVSERLAVELLHAAGSGTVMALLELPEAERDMTLSETAREIVISAITTGEARQQAPSPVAAANALRAQLSDLTVLTEGERHVLAEWLDRIASGRPEQ